MPLIIDTYNVLHVTGVLPPDLAGIETVELIDLIGVSRYSSQEICLVCDGNALHGMEIPQSGRIRVVYSGPNHTADDSIEHMIDRSTAPKRLTIVTSDRRLIRSARKRRCRSMTSNTFLSHLVADHAQGGGPRGPFSKPRDDLGESDVNHWVRVFGLTEDDLSIRSSRRNTHD